VFIADGDLTKGADHAGFKLSASGEAIGLFDHDGLPLDHVTFGPQPVGVSQGRMPDASTNVVSFAENATPGGPNGVTTIRIIAAGFDGQAFVFQFTAGSGMGYTVQYVDALGAGPWLKLQDIAAAAESAPVTVTDASALGAPHRYYRIISVAPSATAATIR
jgi:hypothetical protein